jgi:hypothetical protein
MPRPVPGRGGRRNGQTCGEILPAHIYHNEEKQRCQFLLGSDLFRLVDPPLQPGLVEPYPVRGVWFPSHFRLEGTSHIHNFGLSPVAHGTQGTRPRQYPPPPQPSVERVAEGSHSTVGRIGTHMLLQVPPQDSVVRSLG